MKFQKKKMTKVQMINLLVMMALKNSRKFWKKITAAKKYKQVCPEKI